MQMHRREIFLAVGGLALAAPIMAAAATRRDEDFSIVDRALDRPARRLADAGLVPGRVIPVSGDVVALWQAHLLPQWRVAPRDVNGLTGPATLFCLAELGRTYGLRVIRNDPVMLADGTGLRAWTMTPRRNA